MSKTKKDTFNRRFEREYEDRGKKTKTSDYEQRVEKRLRNAMRSNNVKDIMSLESEYY